MNRSIVMVDWSRYNEPTPRTRDEFLWHQMLLSLLYADVLAQDETLVCSEKMARWFPDGKSFRLLEQLVECGGLSVLKRPWERYPSGLQERALRQPIAARREQLERFSVNNDGAPLQFSENQRAFHNRLEALLAEHARAHRYAGSEKKLGKDLMQEFANLLAVVLTDRRYEKWRKSKFRNITPRTAEDLVRFIDNPDLAIERLKRKKPDQPPRFTPQAGGLVFSTALAVQVAATYAEKEATELQDLIETVFARPFCQDEGAEGRYGRLLRDLPFAMEADEQRDVGVVDVVKVEVEVKIPLRLPVPGPNFAEIIEKIREKDSVKDLRRAMNQLGRDATFTNATNAWHAVSADIASLVSPTEMRETELQMLLVKAGKGLFWGVLADFAWGPPHDVKELFSRLVPPFVGALFSVGGDMCPKLIRADLEQQRITRQLEQAVEFSCVPHPTIKTDEKLNSKREQ